MTVRVTNLLMICSIVAMASITSLQLAEAQVYYSPAASCDIAQPVQYQAAYAPTVAYQPTACQYQTVMRQVPVTTYETRYAVDPATGYYYPYSQPVTTMQWQAQQAPYTTNRPIYPTASGMTSPPSTYAPQTWATVQSSDHSGEIAGLKSEIDSLSNEVADLRRKQVNPSDIKSLTDQVAALRRELLKARQ